MSKLNSVGIIGTGWVGSSVAISLLHSGAANHLMLYDTKVGLAEGEAMDLAHGSSFCPAASVSAVSLEEILGADAIVIAAGKGGSPGDSRLNLLKGNARIALEIGTALKGYKGLVIVVTNPVDVITYYIQQVSGLPPERVIGTGTMLDTVRLRQVLGRDLKLDPRSIHAYVVGEHGDSEVVLWSSANIGGIRLRERQGWNRKREIAAADEVRVAAYEIIKRKGATNHAIGLVTASLLKGILRGQRCVLTVSRVQTGAWGIEGVALSLPTVVGPEGAREIIVPELEDDEREGLESSATILRKAYFDITDV